MKTVLTALVLSLAAAPALAQSVNTSDIFPPVFYPGDQTDTVTQDIVQPDG